MSTTCRVVLRGYFEPSDGRYHWYGRLVDDPALLTQGLGQAPVPVATEFGTAAGRVGALTHGVDCELAALGGLRASVICSGQRPELNACLAGGHRGWLVFDDNPVIRKAGRAMASSASGSPVPDGAVRKKSRGRPAHSGAEIAERRQKIVEAAYQVFTQKGFHDAAISDIAAKMGVGHGTIYRYFDNKRDLLDHVIDFGVGRTLGSLSIPDLTAAANVTEFRTQVTRLGDSLFQQLAESDPGLPRLLLLEAAAIDPEMLHRLLGLMETGVATISVALREAVARDFLRSALDCDATARALFGCVAAAFLAEARSSGMSLEERRRYVDTAVSLVFDNVDPGTAR